MTCHCVDCCWLRFMVASRCWPLISQIFVNYSNENRIWCMYSIDRLIYLIMMLFFMYFARNEDISVHDYIKTLECTHPQFIHYMINILLSLNWILYLLIFMTRPLNTQIFWPCEGSHYTVQNSFIFACLARWLKYLAIFIDILFMFNKFKINCVLL